MKNFLVAFIVVIGIVCYANVIAILVKNHSASESERLVYILGWNDGHLAALRNRLKIDSVDFRLQRSLDSAAYFKK